ncbi:MAG: hypothetical protein AAFX76_13150 [Planctomycetota bacterium]
MLDLPTHLECIAQVNIVGVGFAVNKGERITLPADRAHEFAEKGYVEIVEGGSHVG